MSSLLNFIREHHILAIIEQAISKKKSRLSLNAHDIIEIPELLHSFRALEHLYLHKNRITAVPIGITNLALLNTLTLDYNDISSLPKEIKNLKGLVNLNISHNPLFELIPEVCELENLEALWCNSTGLRELPREIGKLSKLDTFGARNNQLVTIPEEINQLTKLRWLTLETNQIEALPPMDQMVMLVHCNLRLNRLKEFPASLLKLPELMFLLLSNNEISSAEELVEAAPCLESVDLQANPICELTRPLHPAFRYGSAERRAPRRPEPDPARQAAADVEDVSSLSSEDWERSVESDDLDVQYQSEDDPMENEAVGMVLPDLSRYAATAN